MSEELDIQQIVDEAGQQDLSEIPALIVTGIADAPQTPKNMVEQLTWYANAETEAARTAAAVRVYNSRIISNLKGLDFEFTYKNIDAISANMFPGENLSEESIMGRLDVTFEQRKMQNEIYALRFSQLHGDTSDQTEQRINMIKATMPNDSRLDEFTQMMSESSILGKFFLAMGALPYTFASQLPTWISQAKYGVAGAAVAAGGAAWSGAAILPAAGDGFLLGGGIYEFMVESGAAYDKLLAEARDKNVEINKEYAKFSISASSALITVLDVGAFGKVAGSLINQSAKTFGMKITGQIWDKIAFGALGKEIGKAYLIEGGTEGLQDVISDLNDMGIATMSEMAGQPGLDQPTLRDMVDDFTTSFALSGPLAAFASGAMTSMTITRTLRRNKLDVIQAKTEMESELKTEKDIDIAVDEKDVDIAETEIVNEPVPDTPGEPIVKETIEPVEAAVEKPPTDAEQALDDYVAPDKAAAKLNALRQELNEALDRQVKAEEEAFGESSVKESDYETVVQDGTSINYVNENGSFTITKISEGGKDYRIIDKETGSSTDFSTTEASSFLFGDTQVAYGEAYFKEAFSEEAVAFSAKLKAEQIKAAATQTEAAIETRNEMPVKKIVVEKFKNVIRPRIVSSIEHFLNPGVKVKMTNGESLLIKGSTPITGYNTTDYISHVVVQYKEGGSTFRKTFNQVSEATGLSDRQIENRIAKAEEDKVTGATILTGTQPLTKAVSPASALAEAQSIALGFPNAKVVVFTRHGAYVAAIGKTAINAQSMVPGSEAVGYIVNDTVHSSFSLYDALVALGFEDMYEVSESNSAPAGANLHHEINQDGYDVWYYYEGDVSDVHETIASERAALDADLMLKEQEEVSPIDDDEVAIAGGETGVQEVSNTLALIDHVDERYHPVDEKGIRYLWDKHKRINYSNKVAKTRRQLAQLFSIFRHPNVEHVHVVYLDARGRILSNTCESSGMAASTALDTDAIASNMENLGAKKFYVVHNHPSGNVKTSTGDKTMFRDLHERYGDRYGGAVVLNHDHFSWTEPGQDVYTEEKYNPKRKYDRPPTHEYTKSEVAEIVSDRGTAIFVMSGVRKIRAVVSPVRNLTASELMDVVKKYGGSFYNIASDSQLARQHYLKVGRSVQGTTQAQMGLVMAVNKNGTVTTDFQGKLTGDSLSINESGSMALWEEEDPFFKVVPRRVAAWKTFWKTIKNLYNIERPTGLHARTNRHERTVQGPHGSTYIRANFLPAADSLQFDMTVTPDDGSAGPTNVRYEVVQDDTGIGVGIVSDLDTDEVQQAFLDTQAQEIVHELFNEGERYEMDKLNLPEKTDEAIRDFMSNENLYELTPIVSVLEDSGLKEKIMTLAETLKIYDDRGLVDTDEYRMVKQILYRMGQMYAELEGMSSRGLNRTKKLASDIAHSKFSPKAMKEGIVLKAEALEVRLPMTKKQAREYEKIKDIPKEKLTKKENRLQAWGAKKGFESLNYQELNELKESLMHVWKMRYAITKFAYEGDFLSIKAGITKATKEFGDYNPNAARYVDPSRADEKRIFEKVREFGRDFIVNRQLQFFHLVEHLAGPNSVAYQVLYRDLQNADTLMRRYRHRLQDMYSNAILKSGVKADVLAKWSNEEVEIEGIKLKNSQILEIYLHSLQEDNYSSIQKSGMYYSDDMGHRHHIDPTEVDFGKIAQYAAKDEMIQKVTPAFREVYDSLGHNLKTVYETMFGREWTFTENYFPKKVAREFFQKGQDEVSVVNINDGANSRISLAKDYLLDRHAVDPPLELSKRGAFETLSYSIEQETKFIHMEAAFFRASKLLYDPDFKAKIVNSKKMGESYWKLIETGIQDWAGRNMDISRTWDKVLLNVRRQATRAGLGFNPFTASKAAISWIYSLRYMDMRSAAEGLRRASRKGAKEELMRKSPVFRDRVMGGSLPEVHDLLKGQDVTWAEHGMPKKGTKGYDEAMFWMLTTVDAKTVTAVMEGAIYQAELAFREGKMTEQMIRALGFKSAALKLMSSEEKVDAAVAYAEYVLQRTQPDFRPQSRNAFQRGTPIERLASVFGSFVTITHGMTWDLIHRIEHEGLNGVGVKEVVVCVALMAIVNLGNEGIERLKKWALGRDQATFYEMVSRAFLNNTFIVRDINEMVLAKIKYGSYAGKGGTDSFVRGLDTGVTGAVMVFDGLFDNDDHTVVKGLTMIGESLGTFSGMPVAALGYGTDAAFRIAGLEEKK